LIKLHTNAVDNFETLPGATTLILLSCWFSEFVEEPEDEYDLIVSTPFYSETKTENEQRDLARFQSHAACLK
jgi:tRNA1Val (adenine37-N6)-methyltransferase